MSSNPSPMANMSGAPFIELCSGKDQRVQHTHNKKWTAGQTVQEETMGKKIDSNTDM